MPCETRYFKEASSVSFRPAVVYGVKTLWTAGRLVAHRRGVWSSRKFRP